MKSNNQIRIVCLGDSRTAYGMSVSPFETLPFYLEEILNCKLMGYDLEVINLGRPLNGVVDECLQFDMEYVNFLPDVIILLFNGNDHFPSFNSVNKTVKVPREELVEFTLEHVELLVEYVNNISRSFNKKINIVFTYFTTKSEEKGDLWKRIATFAENKGLPFCDLSGLFIHPYDCSFPDYRINETNLHPSPKAYKIAAQHLSDYLLKAGLLYDANDVDIYKIIDNIKENTRIAISHGVHPDMALYRCHHIINKKKQSYSINDLHLEALSSSVINQVEASWHGYMQSMWVKSLLTQISYRFRNMSEVLEYLDFALSACASIKGQVNALGKAPAWQIRASGSAAQCGDREINLNDLLSKENEIVVNLKNTSCIIDQLKVLLPGYNLPLNILSSGLISNDLKNILYIIEKRKLFLQSMLKIIRDLTNIAAMPEMMGNHGIYNICIKLSLFMNESKTKGVLFSPLTKMNKKAPITPPVVQCTVNASSSARMALYVHLKAIVPECRYCWDLDILIPDKLPHDYVFHLPLFFGGTIEVELVLFGGPGEYKINSVFCESEFFSKRTVITMRETEKPNTYSSGTFFPE